MNERGWAMGYGAGRSRSADTNREVSVEIVMLGIYSLVIGCGEILARLLLPAREPHSNSFLSTMGGTCAMPHSLTNALG